MIFICFCSEFEFETVIVLIPFFCSVLEFVFFFMSRHRPARRLPDSPAVGKKNKLQGRGAKRKCVLQPCALQCLYIYICIHICIYKHTPTHSTRNTQTTHQQNTHQLNTHSTHKLHAQPLHTHTHTHTHTLHLQQNLQTHADTHKYIQQHAPTSKYVKKKHSHLQTHT